MKLSLSRGFPYLYHEFLHECAAACLIMARLIDLQHYLFMIHMYNRVSNAIAIIEPSYIEGMQTYKININAGS